MQIYAENELRMVEVTRKMNSGYCTVNRWCLSRCQVKKERIQFFLNPLDFYLEKLSFRNLMPLMESILRVMTGCLKSPQSFSGMKLFILVTSSAVRSRPLSVYLVLRLR